MLLTTKFVNFYQSKLNYYINAFLSSQCTPVSNDSALPNTTNSVSNVSLSSIQSKDYNILKIICSRNYGKARGYDDISNKIIKNM